MFHYSDYQHAGHRGGYWGQYTYPPPATQIANVSSTVVTGPPTQSQYASVADALNILYDINPDLAADIAVAVGATGPGNPNGTPGPVTIQDLPGKNADQSEKGAMLNLNTVMGIDFARHYLNNLDILITIIHEYLHYLNNAPGGQYPTTLAAILAKYPGQITNELQAKAISSCHHSVIHGQSALAIANVCVATDDCDTLTEGCETFFDAFKEGQGYYDECKKFVAKLLSNDDLIAPAAAAGADAGAIYGTMTDEEIKMLSNCCNFAEENNCD